MSKVSVIIPVYNVELYIRECLDSVINQTLHEIEIILVDDGSTDSSGAICDEYAHRDKRITVIHKENGGQGSARNVGLRIATGEYIYLLDSDDFIDDNALEELYNQARTYDLDVLLFGAETFVDGEIPTGFIPEVLNHCTHNLNTVMNGVDYIEASLHHNEYISSNCLRLYRTSIFDHGRNISYCEGIIHEDTDVGVFTLLCAERVMRVNANYYHRRHRPNSTITGLDPLKSAKGYLHAAEMMLRRYDQSYNTKEKQVLIGFFDHYFCTMIYRFGLVDKQNRREIKSLAANVMKIARTGGYPFKRKQTWIGIYSLDVCRWLIGIKEAMKRIG